MNFSKLFKYFVFTVLFFTTVLNSAYNARQYLAKDDIKSQPPIQVIVYPTPQQSVLKLPPTQGEVISAEIARFTGDVTIDGALTAPNVIYNLKSGEGLTILGEQNPVISNTGVLSINGQIGDVTLDLSNEKDPPVTINNTTNTTSSRNVFKSIQVGADMFSADSDESVLTLEAGDGIKLITDKDHKKISISMISPTPTIPPTPTPSSLSFSQLTSGIVSDVLFLIGNSATLGTTGTGIINATQLLGKTWATPDAIGSTTPTGDSFTNLSTSGQNTFSGLGAGIAHLSASGVLSSTAVNLANGDVNGVLSLAQGGTGAASSAGARANLGLNAGGSGDIWVKKGGDTMSGDLSFNGNNSLIDLSNAGNSGITSIIKFSNKVGGGYASGFSKNSTSEFFNLVSNDSNSTVMGGAVTGDATRRFRITAGGIIQLGNGVVLDANLYRSGTNTLGTDSNFALGGILSTLSKNLSLVPATSKYTIIGDAGTSSRGFNSNDDLFISGRLEVDGASYFDASISAKKYLVQTESPYSASLGTDTIPANVTNVTVSTTSITSQSAIFTSPESSLDTPLFVTSKSAGVSFRVNMKTAMPSPVTFSWWIVN